MSPKSRTLLVTAALFMLAALMMPHARFAVNAQSVAPEEQDPKEMRTPDAVYVGTPYDVVSMMLQMAKVKQTDLVYDLGCGDARMLVLAAQKYGARGVGYELDPGLVIESRNNASKNNVQDLVKIIQADIFTLDLSDVDVMPLYLLPEMLARLIPQIEKMKPGSRIVCHEYSLPERYKPDEILTIISNEDEAERRLLLYTLPLKREYEYTRP
jgi:SAM-dependent methyltransferase